MHAHTYGLHLYLHIEPAGDMRHSLVHTQTFLNVTYMFFVLSVTRMCKKKHLGMVIGGGGRGGGGGGGGGSYGMMKSGLTQRDIQITLRRSIGASGIHMMYKRHIIIVMYTTECVANSK